MRREQPLISVVIPVYNGEQYVEKMAEYMGRQTLRDFEVIFVDNGSTDETTLLLQKVCSASENMKFYSEPKRGVSAARNLGIEKACGRYLAFFDVDDIPGEEILQYLYELMVSGESQADMAVCGYQKWKAGRLVEETERHGEKEVFSVPTEKALVCLFSASHYQGYIWNKLYRRDIISKYHIRFAQDICYNEDRLFVVEYVLHCNKIILGTEIQYFYILNAHSAMGQSEYGTFSEEEVTEIDAFDRMIRKLPNFPGAAQLAKKEMAVREMRLFEKMMKKSKFRTFKDSRLRRYARSYHKRISTIRNYEVFIKTVKYILFGWTGMCFEKRKEREDETL